MLVNFFFPGLIEKIWSFESFLCTENLVPLGLKKMFLPSATRTLHRPLWVFFVPFCAFVADCAFLLIVCVSVFYRLVRYFEQFANRSSSRSFFFQACRPYHIFTELSSSQKEWKLIKNRNLKVMKTYKNKNKKGDVNNRLSETNWYRYDTYVTVSVEELRPSAIKSVSKKNGFSKFVLLSDFIQKNRCPRFFLKKIYLFHNSFLKRNIPAYFSMTRTPGDNGPSRNIALFLGSPYPKNSASIRRLRGEGGWVPSWNAEQSIRLGKSVLTVRYQIISPSVFDVFVPFFWSFLHIYDAFWPFAVRFWSFLPLRRPFFMLFRYFWQLAVRCFSSSFWTFSRPVECDKQLWIMLLKTNEETCVNKKETLSFYPRCNSWAV